LVRAGNKSRSDEADKDTFRREMADADILLHVLEPVTAAVIDAAPHLKLIQKIGIGVNTIDLDAARRRGIAICNMPGTNTQAVAEMTLLLMLAILRRLAQPDRSTRAGEGWKFEPELPDDLGELSGRTVGLVGFGAVARRLVPMLEAIGAKVALHVPIGPGPHSRVTTPGKPRRPGLGVYGGMNENFVLVAGRSRWQADGV
jgi:phosphoglycerate dehydrogenase-like enzyme